MISKKKEYLQQKISTFWKQKETGQVEWVVGLFFLIFLMVLLFAGMQMEIWRAVSVSLEDTLAASNLASAIIDIEEYGISHRIRLTDPQEAWERYSDAVRENMNLNEEWEHPSEELLSGPVTVVNYTIYNVERNEVTVWQRDIHGQWSSWQEMYGQAHAPNGQLIEYTSIYSELRFEIKGLFGTLVEAHKGKLVDIVGEPERLEEDEDDGQEEEDNGQEKG